MKRLPSLTLGLLLALGFPLVYAQGGGSGGGGGGSGGSAGGASSSGSAGSSPSIGSVGPGSLGSNSLSQGPTNSVGLNSGNNPSGIGNADSSQRNGQSPNSAPPRPGTNSLGTANASGGGGGRSIGKHTRTNEQATDATVDSENKQVDRAVKSICRGC